MLSNFGVVTLVESRLREAREGRERVGPCEAREWEEEGESMCDSDCVAVRGKWWAEWGEEDSESCLYTHSCWPGIIWFEYMGIVKVFL